MTEYQLKEKYILFLGNSIKIMNINHDLTPSTSSF